MRARSIGKLALAALLTACPAPPGQFCSSGSQCPVNSYCLANQCLAPSTISQNLSVVVTPTDPALAVQQFLPEQYQTVDGFSTIILNAPQVLTGQVALPPNCSDAGYPVHFQFTGPTVIPGLANSFQFDTDGNGVLSGVLPIGSYAERVSTAVACAAPLFADDVVIQPNIYKVDEQIAFDAPFVPGQPAPGPTDGGDEDAGGLSPNIGGLSLDIAGQVHFADAGLRVDAGLPVGAAVRILALADAGSLPGSLLSGDQPLQFIDGGLWFGSTFVPGGPAALPVPSGAITPRPALCVTGRTNYPSCDQFIVEIGPSKTLPFLTTFDVLVNAPEIDGGENPAVTFRDSVVPSATVTLPFNPMSTVNLPIVAVDTETPPKPVLSAAVTISSVDEGIAACPPPESGVTCHLAATGITDFFKGTFTFPVVLGRYALTLDPPSPLGSSTTVVDVLDGGELSVVSGPGTLTAEGVALPALAPFTLKGTIREPGVKPGVNGPLLPSGEVKILTIADLAPVAIGAVTDGMFDLLVPPGLYLLLIEPDSSTRLPVFHTSITIDENLPSQSYALAAPGQLSGIVEVEVDGGLPIPTQAYLEFYEVTSDSDGGVVTYPVATAVTDSQGRWSAAGPPGQ